jgi:hypothetical protein
MRGKKLLIGIAAATAAMGAGSGVAFAVWTVSGAGSGGGAATVAQSLVVTEVTPSGAGATLYPGGPAGPVYFTIQNPNPFAVTINGYAWGTPTSNNTTACPNANVTIDANAPLTANLALAAGQTLTAVQINGVLDLSHNAPNGCQGVSFNAPVTVSATQQ